MRGKEEGKKSGSGTIKFNGYVDGIKVPTAAQKCKNKKHIFFFNVILFFQVIPEKRVTSVPRVSPHDLQGELF